MKKLFVPLTLERVGSEGKFFTDNTVLKLLATVVGTAILGALIWSSTRPFISALPATILGGLAALIVAYYLIRFWVLRERELFKLLQKLTQHKIVNVGEFSDVYDFADNICLHNSGYMSGFVKIIRGSTLGMTDTEKNAYYKCLKYFEDSILSNEYSFKVFNSESPTIKDTIFKDQKNGCRQTNQKVLEHNLDLKNKYTRIFMENCLRDEQFIYCIITEIGDIEHFQLKIEQAMRNLTNKHISDVIFMSREDIIKFATEFNDVEYFEFDTESEEEFRDILTVEK